MLDFMRQKAGSWVMMILFGTIIFVFALNYGPWAGQTGIGNKPYAAIVNGKVITLPEMQMAYRRIIAYMQQFRPGFTPELAEQENFRGTAINQLISSELLSQLAHTNGLHISDEELAKTIKKEIFGDEPFDLKTYQRILHSNLQLSEASFEAYLRRGLLAEKMSKLLETGVSVTSDEVKDYFNVRNEKASVNYFEVNPKYFTAKSPSKKEIENFVASNEKAMQDYYNSHLNEFRKSKQVKASHILFKFDGDAEDSAKKAMLKKAEDLRKTLTANNFAAMAKKHSSDGSASKGGDLGYFSRGTMVKPFEDKAFSMKAGEISDVVESPFGYHIIHVKEIKPAVKKEFESVRQQIAKAILLENSQDSKAIAYTDLILKQLQRGKSAKQVSAHGLKEFDPKNKKSLAPVRGSTKLFTQTTRYLPNIGNATSLIQAAFKLDSKKRVYDEVVQLNGKYYALSLDKREKPSSKAFNEEKEKLEKTLLSQKQRQFMQDYLAYLNNEAKIIYNDSLVGQRES